MNYFLKRVRTKGIHLLMCFFFVFSGFVSSYRVLAEEAPSDSETVSATDFPTNGITETLITQHDLKANSLHAYSAVLYDGEAGRVLFEKNGYEVLPMASTTKIMTLLVVLEHTNPEDIVTVSKNAAVQPDVQLNMNTGEQYYVKDLCYSLMLESHNDTAVALAEHVGGTVEGFASMMNAKAKALGAYSANFVTPNGLDADGHGIHAADLAKIAAYAVKQEDFREITTTASHTFSDVENKRTFTVANKDLFLSMMDGAIGVKTGFTGKAGYCFVGALEREDRLLISVVLASGWPPHKTYKWSDTRLLMNYGLETFKKLPLLDASTGLPELPAFPVRDGKMSTVPLTYDSQALVQLMGTELLRDGTETVELLPEFSIPMLTAPVATGEKVGELIVKMDGDCIQKIPIQTAEAVVPVDYVFYLCKAMDSFFSGNAINMLLQLHP